MKTRKEAVNLIEKQFNYESKASKEKEHQYHYGRHELRELMDFIYDGEPKEDELILSEKNLVKVYPH